MGTVSKKTSKLKNAVLLLVDICKKLWSRALVWKKVPDMKQKM
jgi:hypothetical protein